MPADGDEETPLPGAPPVLSSERRGSGPGVVFVHGFTQTGRSWAPVLDALAPRCPGHALVTVDLPGHGGSAGVVVDDLEGAALALSAAGGRAVYVGYSLGGRVALTLALTAPAAVRALVLVGASPGIDNEAERRSRRAADEALADRLDPGAGREGIGLEAFLEEWLSGPLFAHLTPEQADRASRRANTPAGLAAALRSLGAGTQVPSSRWLSRREMPVLLLAGEHDLRYRALCTEMAARIGANAASATIAGAGHAAPFERPGLFADVLERFLAGLAPEGVRAG